MLGQLELGELVINLADDELCIEVFGVKGEMIEMQLLIRIVDDENLQQVLVVTLMLVHTV